MASRRSNKSHKVPNVKLRPAVPQPYHRDNTPPSSLGLDRSSSPVPLDLSSSFIDPCPRPFKGVTLCATGVDKTTLFSCASKLGANTTSDFTDRVTHLIASAHGGAKYMCALERKIPIMQPSWVHDSFEIWQRGDDVDFDESVNSHRLPIFNDLTICLSGISSVPRRIEINRIVRAQGGEYTKVLERPVVVTHLLCGGDVGGGAAPEEESVEEESQDLSIAGRSSKSKSKGKGKAKGKGKPKAGGDGADDGGDGDEVVETEKMKYARKFNKTGEAKIMMVWEEWFWDCLEFGGRFPESNYLVDRPRPPRKQPPTAPAPPAPPLAASLPLPPQSQLPPSQQQADPTTDALDQFDLAPSQSRRCANDAYLAPLGSVLLGSRGFRHEGRTVMRVDTGGGGAGVGARGIPSGSRGLIGTRSTPALGGAGEGEIIEVGGVKSAAGIELAKSSKASQQTGRWDAPEMKKRSALHTFSRANSFAPVGSFAAGAGAPSDELGGTGVVASRAPLRKSLTAAALFGRGREREGSAGPSRVTPGPGLAPVHVSAQGAGAASTGVFKEKRFRVRGEARSERVRGAIEAAGGVWVEGKHDAEDEEEGEGVCDYVVVRLASGSTLFRADPSPSARLRYRTECWLEACLAQQRICEPEEHIAYVPVPVQGPLRVRRRQRRVRIGGYAQGDVTNWEEEMGEVDEGVRAVVALSSSGLDAAEDLWLKRLVKALGITHSPTFTKHCTHLLCPSRTGAKFEKAGEWGVPIVDWGWVEEVVKTGIVPLTARENRSDEKEGGKEKGKDREKERSIKSKGKGKERAVEVDAPVNTDVRMMDITNGRSSSPPLHPPTSSPVPPPHLDYQDRFEPEPESFFAHELEQQQQAQAQILPNDSEFFKPNGLLGTTPTPNPNLNPNAVPVLSPVPQAPPRSQTLPPLTPSLPRPASDAAEKEQDYVPSSSPPQGTPLDLRVPSSATPSPMKIPMDKGKGKATEISREKTKEQIGVSTETARALQESLTSLLGRKRSVGSMEDLVESARGVGESVGVGVVAGAGQAARAGKRQRPRSRGSRSRQGSATNVFGKDAPAPPLDDHFDLHAESYSFDPDIAMAGNPENDDDDDELNLKPGQVLGGVIPVSRAAGRGGDDGSVTLVRYEDPEQRDERKKLMSLLGDPVSSMEASGSGVGKAKGVNGKTVDAKRGRKGGKRTAGF